MRASTGLASALALCGALIIAGCGGGGPSTSTGSIRVAVLFPPQTAELAPRGLPTATNSVRIQVLNPGALTALAGDQIVARQGTTSAVFDPLRAGPCLVRALAYASADGSGQVIAQAEVVTSVVAGETTVVELVTEALVMRVEVQPEQLSLNSQASGHLTATCYDADDKVIVAPVVWRSDSANVSVSADGTVTGAHEGSAVVRATHEASGLSDTCTVTVTRPPTVVRVDVQPATLALNLGATGKLTATCYDADDKVIVAPVVWRSDSANVSVSADGTVTGAHEGSAVVRATHVASGLSDTCTVTVTRAPTVVRVDVQPATLALNLGATGKLTATCYDAANTVIPGTVTWSSDSANVSVSADGTVTGAHEGSAVVRATHEASGLSDTCTVTVTRAPTVVRVDVQPATLALELGTTGKLTATCYDARDNVVQAAVTWSAAGGGVSVAADGTVTALAEGTVLVRATHVASGSWDTCTVTVTRRQAARVVVTPNRVVLNPGNGFQTQLTAVVYDAAGVVIPYATVTWTSDSAPVVTVDAKGLVTSANHEDNINATVTATAGPGVTATCSVHVAPAG